MKINKRTIVIKIGTSTLTKADGSLNKTYIGAFCAKLALVKADNEIVLVSSGAIGAGVGLLKLKERPKSVRAKQALAAVGQPLIMDAYRDGLKPYGINIAQVLLSRRDFDDKTRYANLQNALNEILSYGIIPVINENDTVAVDEIKFGDNDTLAAHVAVAVKAQALLIVTDVDGLYGKTPSDRIGVVKKINKKVYALARGGLAGARGTGGMFTKIAAADIAAAKGIKTVVFNGKKNKSLERVLRGEDEGTVFMPQVKRAKK